MKPIRRSLGVGRVPDVWLVTGALTIALVLRVVLVVATIHRYVPVNDAADFSRIAASISQGHGFGPSAVVRLPGPSAFRTPLWPAVLAGLYTVTGVSWTAGRLLVAALSTAFVGVIGATAWTLGGRRVGMVTMALAAIYPPLILAGYGLNYEPLMGILVLSALLCSLRWRRRRSWGWIAGAGLLSGAAVLCRENAGLILVPICIFVGHGLRGDDRRRALLRVAAVVSCLVVVVAPWTIRNAVELHAFVPVSDSPGYALAGTYNPTSAANQATWIPASSVPAYEPILADLPRGAGEAQYTGALQKAAVRYVEHHPGYVVEVVAWNTVRLFDLRGPQDSNWLAPLIPWPVGLIEAAVVGFYAVALLALAAIALRKVRGVPRAIWTFPLLWILSVVLTSSILQYRFVVEPFFLLLASFALLALHDRLRRTPGARPGL